MQLLAVGRSGEACEFACTLPQRLVPASQRSDASASGPCARAPCFMLLESPAAVSCPSNGHMLRIALCGLTTSLCAGHGSSGVTFINLSSTDGGSSVILSAGHDGCIRTWRLPPGCSQEAGAEALPAELQHTNTLKTRQHITAIEGIHALQASDGSMQPPELVYGFQVLLWQEAALLLQNSFLSPATAPRLRTSLCGAAETRWSFFE